MPHATIRVAEPGDMRELRELAERTFVDAFSPDNQPEWIASYVAEAFRPQRVSSELADPARTTFVAEAGGAFIGYAQLWDAEPPPEIGEARAIELVRLYVDAPYHGRGIAQELMSRCLETSRESGFDAIWLGVWEHNRRAQAFYAKYGFTRCGEQIFQLGDDAQTDWVMRLLL